MDGLSRQPGAQCLLRAVHRVSQSLPQRQRGHQSAPVWRRPAGGQGPQTGRGLQSSDYAGLRHALQRSIIGALGLAEGLGEYGDPASVGCLRRRVPGDQPAGGARPVLADNPRRPGRGPHASAG